jgi:lysyl-tRNA synthetase class 2
VFECFNYPNDFEKKYEISHLIEEFGKLSKEDLEKKNATACNAGRVVLKREMGKVVFMTIEDFSGRIQAYFSKNNLEERLEEIKDFDLGDIVGIEGVLFRTKTDELTIEVKDFKLITKSLNPMPEKHAGLTDIETIYRQRYVDLMSNKDSREIFVKRNKIIQSIRKNLEEAGNLQVKGASLESQPRDTQLLLNSFLWIG